MSWTLLYGWLDYYFSSLFTFLGLFSFYSFFPFSQMNSKPKQKASWNTPLKPVFISRDWLSMILFPITKLSQGWLISSSSSLTPCFLYQPPKSRRKQSETNRLSYFCLVAPLAGWVGRLWPAVCPNLCE